MKALNTDYPELRISKTIYPNEEKRLSPNTNLEWYGLVETKTSNDDIRRDNRRTERK